MPPRKGRSDSGPLHVVPSMDGPMKEPSDKRSRPGRRPESARPRPEGRVQVKLQVEGKMAQLINGELSVDDMDDEELGRMQFRDKNGGFSGRPPSTLPRDVVNKIRTELIRRGNSILSESFQVAIQTLTDIAVFGENDAVRLKAIGMVLERVAGKVPDKLELGTPDKPFEVLINRVTRSVRRADGEEVDSPE